jgi:hypothetical protein
MNKKILLILVLISVFILTTASYSEYKITSCTNFAAVSGDIVLFGNSEDASGDHPLKDDPTASMVWFLPATEDSYGMMQLGWYYQDSIETFQGGMNEFGLCYDATAIPDTFLNDKPDLPYNPDNSYIWQDILGKCKDVDEAVEYIKNYNFGVMWFQFMITDETGKTVVVSPGKDGELVFNYMDPSVGLIVQTNFNRSNPISHFGSYPDPRYDDSYTYLASIVDSGNVSVFEFEKVLDIVSQKGHDAYTPYSNIFDPVKKVAYIYFAAQFDEAVPFNLSQELTLGEHEYRISELVSEATLERGLEYHKNYLGKEVRFTILAVFGIIAAIVVVSLISMLLGRRRRKKITGK